MEGEEKEGEEEEGEEEEGEEEGKGRRKKKKRKGRRRGKRRRNTYQGFFQDLGQGGAKRQYVIWWGGMALSTCTALASSKGGRE